MMSTRSLEGAEPSVSGRGRPVARPSPYSWLGIFPGPSRGGVRSGGLSAAFVAALAWGAAFAGTVALADGPSRSSGSRPTVAVGTGSAAYAPGHQSSLRIAPGTPLPQTRRVRIGADKSMLVDVPVDLANVLVSNPEVIDAVVQTTRQVYLLAKGAGEANAFFLGPDGQKVLLLEVVVQRDLSGLEDAMARLIPGSRIKVEAMGDNVVLTGSVASPVDANRAADLALRYVKKKDGVVNMLAVDDKEQVLLKVTVAEMQRSGIRRLGVSLPDAMLRAGSISFGSVNGFPITAGASDATGVLKWEKNGTVYDVVKALEQSGLTRVLAEPTLTAISGETAKFLAGGELPIPVPGPDRTVTVQWKPFGASVVFKPTVLAEGRISLSVMAEVSEITSDGAVRFTDIAIPALKVRRAETTLELPSGGTLAMAGLLSDDTRQSIEGIPGLKSLPILGTLFRSTDYQRRETELVILVTPYIAKHAQRKDLARPDDGFAPASDLKALFLGDFNRIFGRPGSAPPVLEGDYGFIIDHPRHGGSKG
jgi:pilus assembly protein CpaC